MRVIAITPLLLALYGQSSAFAAHCDGTLAKTPDVVACAKQLTARGHRNCGSVGAGGAIAFCKIGTAEVVGVGIGSGTTHSSWYALRACLFRTLLTFRLFSVDIARAVGFILDDCTTVDHFFGQRTAGKLIEVAQFHSWNSCTDAIFTNRTD